MTAGDPDERVSSGTESARAVRTQVAEGTENVEFSAAVDETRQRSDDPSYPLDEERVGLVVAELDRARRELAAREDDLPADPDDAVDDALASLGIRLASRLEPIRRELDRP